MKIITTLALLAGIYTSANAQVPVENDSTVVDKKNKIELKSDFVSIENALTSAGNMRTRLLANGMISYHSAKLGYDFLDDTENLSPSNFYYGRNELNLSKEDSNNGLCAVVKADQDGIFDVKYGIKNTSIPEKLGTDYGWIEALLNKDAANVTFFVGKDLAKGLSIEMYNDTEIPFGNKVSNYTELQLNKKIIKHLDAYARAEIANGNMKEGVYMIGISIKP
jgi:hypothetical protein